MRFVVDFRNRPSPSLREFPHVVLAQDNWDDFGYQTTFYSKLHLGPGREVDLGNVKILKKDQIGGPTEMPRGPFPRLDPSYCSLGADVDYYEELHRAGPHIYEPFLRGLRDAAYDEKIKIQFEREEGFRVSLLRFSGAERVLSEASKLFTESPPRKRRTGFRVVFKTQITPDSNLFTIAFDFRRQKALPNRFNILIGYNGTGKTRLLSNLAIAASGFGYTQKQEALSQSAGRFIGSKPPFRAVIVVSYSAFDRFILPGRNQLERTRLQQTGDIFGYVYCGLRERDEISGSDRLKTPDEIHDEFRTALDRVRLRDERWEVLRESLKPLLRDASFQRIGLSPFHSNSADLSDIETLFDGLSSGHKIVIKIVTELVAHLAGGEPTLVLIDEPEIHLHPPLLAAFLKSIRTCLEELNGYAVIATHSPVVLQEIPARYVHVLRRVGDQSALRTPSIETFGENIGVITQEVFNLDDGSTDWHETLRTLAAQYDFEEIEQLFDKQLGFAARSYIRTIKDHDDR